MPSGISQMARRIMMSPIKDLAQLGIQEWLIIDALIQSPA